MFQQRSFFNLKVRPHSKKLNPKQIVISSPKSIERTYEQLTEVINTTKAEISDGIPLRFGPNGFLVYTPFRYISTEALLGLLLISCGVLGSIMSALREEGGSTLFILNSVGADVPYNAYSTALAGVNAGMFSEKLYIALSSLTDRALRQDS